MTEKDTTPNRWKELKQIKERNVKFHSFEQSLFPSNAFILNEI